MFEFASGFKVGDRCAVPGWSGWDYGTVRRVVMASGARGGVFEVKIDGRRFSRAMHTYLGDTMRHDDRTDAERKAG